MARTSVIIVADDEAEVGGLVEVNVNVVNISGSDLYAICSVRIDSEYLSVTPSEPWLIIAGQGNVFTTFFNMPNRNILITAESFYELLPGEWALDNTATKTVLLIAAPPPPPTEPEFRNLEVAISRR